MTLRTSREQLVVKIFPLKLIPSQIKITNQRKILKSFVLGLVWIVVWELEGSLDRGIRIVVKVKIVGSSSENLFVSRVLFALC